MRSNNFVVHNYFFSNDDSKQIRYNSFIIKDKLVPDLKFCMDSLYFDQAENILEGLMDLVRENIEIKKRNRMNVDEEIEFLIDLGEIRAKCINGNV